MKTIIIAVSIFICTCSAFGQQAVDYLLKAKALNENGKPEAAVSSLEKAIVEIKDNRLFIERASAYIMIGNYSAAISDYNEANRLAPSSGEYGLARIYSLKGDAKTALYHLELNLTSPLKKSEKEIMLDPVFGSIENRPEWRQFWKKEWYADNEKVLSEIEYYVSSGKINESKDLLIELKKNYPGNDDSKYAEAIVNMSAGKFSETIKILSELVSRFPENEKYLRTLAKAQFSASNPAGASVTYSRLISAGIADADLYLLRADCFKKTGENDKTLSDIEKYLEFYPGNKKALSMAGKAEIASGDNLNALKYFSENLKLHPNDAECYIDRANSYLVSRTWDWAIKDFTMSLDLDPSNSDVWLNKGVALLNLGKADDACHDFRKSLSLGNKRASEYISRNCIK